MWFFSPFHEWDVFFFSVYNRGQYFLSLFWYWVPQFCCSLTWFNTLPLNPLLPWHFQSSFGLFFYPFIVSRSIFFFSSSFSTVTFPSIVWSLLFSFYFFLDSVFSLYSILFFYQVTSFFLISSNISLIYLPFVIFLDVSFISNFCICSSFV